MLNLLSDKRTPTCPHCGMAKLEVNDVIASWDEGNRMVEHTIGVCPNCEHEFDYHQYFSHDPIGYGDIEEITEEDEEDE